MSRTSVVPSPHRALSMARSRLSHEALRYSACRTPVKVSPGPGGRQRPSTERTQARARQSSVKQPKARANPTAWIEMISSSAMARTLPRKLWRRARRGRCRRSSEVVEFRITKRVTDAIHIADNIERTEVAEQFTAALGAERGELPGDAGSLGPLVVSDGLSDRSRRCRSAAESRAPAPARASGRD